MPLWQHVTDSADGDRWCGMGLLVYVCVYVCVCLVCLNVYSLSPCRSTGISCNCQVLLCACVCACVYVYIVCVCAHVCVRASGTSAGPFSYAVLYSGCYDCILVLWLTRVWISRTMGNEYGGQTFIMFQWLDSAALETEFCLFCLSDTIALLCNGNVAVAVDIKTNLNPFTHTRMDTHNHARAHVHNRVGSQNLYAKCRV